MIEDHSQQRSAILSRMSFVDMYEANLDKLQVIIDVIIPTQARFKSDISATEAHVLAVYSAL